MSIFTQPWRLVPNRIRGNGGREIDKLRGIYPPVDDSSGSEAWIGSVTRVGNPPPGKPHYGCSEVELPDGRQMYLFEAIGLNPDAVLGEAHMQRHGHGLGMLVKYLDAASQYGLQCHPTRPFAKLMWDSDYGKEESWYVIGTRDDTAEPPYILLGFKEGVTREDWERHYRRDDITALENMCHKIPVQIGEAYFVGGGVPHALGAGCLVIEVQEPCDITLGARPYARVKQWLGSALTIDENTYDERLLGAYLYNGCGEAENLRRWRIPRKRLREGAWGAESIVIGPEQTAFFSFTEIIVQGNAPLRLTGYPQVGIVLSGQGVIEWTGGEMAIKRGDEVFIPHNVPGVSAKGNMSLVLCHPEGVMY